MTRPFLVDAVVNCEINAITLADTGCTVVGVTSKEFAASNNLARIPINPWPVHTYDDKAAETIST